MSEEKILMRYEYLSCVVLDGSDEYGYLNL